MAERSYYFGRLQKQPYSIYRVSHECWNPGDEIRRQCRDNYVIIVILSGSGVFTGPAGVEEVGAGSLVALAPPHPHHLLASFDNPLVLHRIVSVGEKMEGMFREHLGGLCLACRPGNIEKVQSLAMNIFAEAERGQPLAQEIITASLPLLLYTIQQGLIQRQSHPSRSRTRWLQARAWLGREYTAPVTVRDAAHEVGISPEHLNRIFRRFGDESPAEYLRNLRLSRAMELLQTTGMTLDEIAVRIGYGDAYAFGKAFKRVLGSSPGAWREAGQR